MLPRRIQFDVFVSEVHCECGEKFIVAAGGRIEVSPHLRAMHGFGEHVEFEVTEQVICPPRETVVAYEPVFQESDF